MAKKKVRASVKGAEIGKRIGGAIGREIEKEMDGGECKDWKWPKSNGGGSGAVYGLGMIGAAVFFIQHATGFWVGVLGILKALVWPAILVYHLLGAVGV